METDSWSQMANLLYRRGTFAYPGIPVAAYGGHIYACVRAALCYAPVPPSVCLRFTGLSVRAQGGYTSYGSTSVCEHCTSRTDCERFDPYGGTTNTGAWTSLPGSILGLDGSTSTSEPIHLVPFSGSLYMVVRIRMIPL